MGPRPVDILLAKLSAHISGSVRVAVENHAGPTPTPIGGVPLDVIRYIASAFLSEASAATLSRSENSGVSELSEPEGGHPA